MRDTPGVELVHGEVPGEAGAARGGAEALGEHTYGDRGLGVWGARMSPIWRAGTAVHQVAAAYAAAAYAVTDWTVLITTRDHERGR